MNSQVEWDTGGLIIQVYIFLAPCPLLRVSSLLPNHLTEPGTKHFSGHLVEQCFFTEGFVVSLIIAFHIASFSPMIGHLGTCFKPRFLFLFCRSSYKGTHSSPERHTRIKKKKNCISIA